MNRKLLFCLLLYCFYHAGSHAQSVFPLTDGGLSKEFHKGRRDALRALLPDSSVAVFFANPTRNRSNDIDYQYHQDPDFYYLTGLNEPNAMLLIFKNTQELDSITTNEIIFVQEHDVLKESWTGKRLGAEGVKDLLGFNTVFYNKEFIDFKIKFSNYKKVYYPEFYQDVRDNPKDNGDLYDLTKHFKFLINDKADRNLVFELNQFMAGLREIKGEEEIKLLRKAILITCEAQMELMKVLKPGMSEFQAQALVEFYFKTNGSEYPGYPSIVGSGANSCILHYTSNRKKLEEGDLMVCDAGAEYHGYTADVTRTLPVNGIFSPEEKIIYNIVLEAQLAGITVCKKGNDFRASHKAALEIIQKGLLDNGIIKVKDAYLTYFFHGTSHHLGLDVHDPGLYGKLSPGNVITVEPGIYIPQGSDCDPKWWNIGVRIEDDILVTEGEPEVLSKSLPKKIVEIEMIMEKN